MSVADTLEFDPDRANPQGAADTRPPPAWFDFNWEGTKASAEQAYWDVPGRNRETRSAEIMAAASALAQLNGRSSNRYMVIPYGAPGEMPIANEAAFWSDLAELRKTQPDALSDFARDRADYDARRKKAFAEGDADRAERMKRNGFLGNLAGGMAGAFTDPINLATLPLGGFGKSAAQRIITEGLVQAGIQTAELPLLALERDSQGRELTGQEAAWFVGMGGLGGMAFRGAGEGGAVAARKAWAKVPLDAKAALALRFSGTGRQLTPDQMAAIHVTLRDAEVDATSPFVRRHDALEAHGRKIDETIAELGRVPEPARAGAPGQMGSAGAPAIETYMRKVRGPESGGDDAAVNPFNGKAVGRYQFMPDTWVSYYKRAIGGRGLSREQILALRTNGEVQDRVMRFKVADDAAFLRGHGFPVTEANLYLVHFAGQAGARKVLTNPGVRVATLLGQAVEDQNPFLKGKTAQAMIDYTERHMGAGGEVRAGDAGGLMDPDGVIARPEALDAQRPLVEMPELDRGLFASEAEWRRAQDELDAQALGIDAGELRQARWIEARDRLLDAQEGEARGALWHPEVGSIDLKWGNADTGLAKIAARHGEVLEDLPRLLESMGLKSRSDNRVILQSLDHRAVIRLDYDGEAQNWLLSAYQVRGKAPPQADYRGAGGGAQDRSPALGADRNIDPVDQMDKAVTRQILDENTSPVRVGDLAKDASRVQRGFLIDPQGRIFQLNEGFEHIDFGRAASAEEAAGFAALTTYGREIALRRAAQPTPAQTRAIEKLTKAATREGREVTEGGLLGDIDTAYPAVPSRTDMDSPAMRDELEAEGLAGPVVTDREAGAAFDDPRGEGVARAADTAWHDIQAAQDMARESGAAIDEAEAALAAVDPELVDQINREIGEALGGEAYQMSFDLGDGKGERTLADIEAELRADEEAIATIESCLTPGPMGGGA
ncbi:MAG: hypothetical protein VYD90_10250 [Pseudomonadota bacterium]|nr:hypothetical protein [Pseudomonadota bacterium]